MALMLVGGGTRITRDVGGGGNLGILGAIRHLNKLKLALTASTFGIGVFKFCDAQKKFLSLNNVSSE